MLKLDPVALTDVGRRRDHNEDYLGDQIIRNGSAYNQETLTEKGYLFAVADGMGGHASGEVASEMAVTTLFEHFYNGPSSGNLADDLKNSIIFANSQVYQAGEESSQGQMGTTLTISLIKGNRALVGNVGDSRTYLIRNGIPLRITRDHSLVQEQIEMGAITPEQAQNSMIKNIITRAIGHRDEVEPDLFEQEIQSGDILLLCSDGLHGLVQELEMGTIAASTSGLNNAAQQLIDLANIRGGVDNISVLLVGITEVGEPILPFLSVKPSSKADSAITRLVPNADQVTNRLQIPDDDKVTTHSKTLNLQPQPSEKGWDESQATSKISVGKKRSGGVKSKLFVAFLVIILGGAIGFLIYSGSNPINSNQATPTQNTTISPMSVPTATAQLSVPGFGVQVTTSSTSAASSTAASSASPSKSKQDDGQSQPGSGGKNESALQTTAPQGVQTLKP